jgi:PspA-Associated protein
MIVRIMGEGQWRLDDETIGRLNELDNKAAQALAREDQEELQRVLGTMAEIVRDRGEQLDDADLHPSDTIVPPTDLTLEEAHELFEGEGLIPDLPAA